MLRNIKNSRNSGTSQVTQLWVVFKHDFKKFQAFFTKCSKEQDSYGYHSRILYRFQHPFHLGIPWSFIHSILSFSNEEWDSLVSTLNYPNWITFSRPTNNNNDHSCIILYINTHLSYLQFSLWKDIFNYKDVNCFSFFNNGDIFFMLNIYLDGYQTTLKYLKNTKVNLWNVLIIAGDFNIRDSI